MTELLTIVMPAFNESASLEANLPRWLQTCAEEGWRLIVVDDGSQDKTEAVLRAHSAHPLLTAYRHRANRGYGEALKTGLSHVETPYAATMDADGQHRIEDVAKLLDVMLAGEADLLIGARPARDSSGTYRRLGKWIIRQVARLLFPVPIHDLNSGFKLYRTEIVRRFLPWSPGSMAFSDVMTLLHLNSNLKVLEVPIVTSRRQVGRSTINTGTAVETVLEIINVVMWFRPLKIFLPVASALVLVGVGWGVPFLLAGRGMSGVSLLLILSGMMVGMLGLLAEQLANLRRVDLPDSATQRIAPR